MVNVSFFGQVPDEFYGTIAGMLSNQNTVNFRVNLSGFDKLMPDVDANRVYVSRLVHQLDGGKVVYCTRSRQLYFWEPENGPLRSVIESALKSKQLPCLDQPVQLDNMGVFMKPRKVTLEDDALQVVITALRLSGVKVQFNQSAHHQLQQQPLDDES
ncbi:MAG: hypothetical protein ACI8P9_002326 [Parasphingorhabdus sp.]|jgi:hypothetical protein